MANASRFRQLLDKARCREMHRHLPRLTADQDSFRAFYCNRCLLRARWLGIRDQVGEFVENADSTRCNCLTLRVLQAFSTEPSDTEVEIDLNLEWLDSYPPVFDPTRQLHRMVALPACPSVHIPRPFPQLPLGNVRYGRCGSRFGADLHIYRVHVIRRFLLPGLTRPFSIPSMLVAVDPCLEVASAVCLPWPSLPSQFYLPASSGSIRSACFLSMPVSWLCEPFRPLQVETEVRAHSA